MSRNIALDILKLVMAFMVIALHARFLSESSQLAEFLTVNGLFRIAVPIFFIINGYYFYKIQNRADAKHWFTRVLVLYLVWMAFYAFFWLRVSEISVAEMSKLVEKIIFGHHHLWYVSGMLVAAFMLYIIRHANSAILLSSCAVLFLVGVLIQYLGNYHYFDDNLIDKLFNKHWLHRNALLFAYPFFCIGYLINRHSIQHAVNGKTVSLFISIGITLLFLESLINYSHVESGQDFDNYLSLIILCPFIFLLFIKVNISSQNKNIALYSSAIFFIHSFFLSVFRRYTDAEGSYLTFLVAISSVAAAYFIIRLNKRLRFIL